MRKHAFWQLGFRPFFLIGSLFAAVAICAWAFVFFGAWPGSAHYDPLRWHGHEMIYGFGVAVTAGFVLTAAQNWTGRRGVHGRHLQALVLLWALARILIWTMPRPSPVAAAVDLAFLPCLGASLFPYLRDRDLKAERVFFVYFALFFLGNLLTHLDALGILAGEGRTGLRLGLYTLIAMIAFMGGRVIPFFTESSIARAQPREVRRTEVLSHVAVWGFLATATFLPTSPATVATSFLAAAIHFLRLRGWYVRRIRRAPLIWVLHVSYLWVVAGFLLTGLASLGLFPSSSALHAFTVGGVGLLTYGMMSRVSLGHTGRRLHPSVFIVVGYHCLNAAAGVRVFGASTPSLFVASVWLSAALWFLGFTLFCVIYVPILVSPRVDGKPG